MEKQNLGLRYKKKTINLEVHKVSEFKKGIGLMFSRRKKAKILLFEFKKPTKLKIHSLFVSFPFLAIWLDKRNSILEKKIIKPWQIAIKPKKYFYKLIEIPINNKNRKILKTLVDNKKFKKMFVHNIV